MFNEFNIESMFRDFMSDPVLFMSFGILALTLGLMIFYTWYFIKNVMDAEAPLEEMKDDVELDATTHLNVHQNVH